MHTMTPDIETDIRKCCCPADEFVEIHAYLTKHGCEVLYLSCEDFDPELDDPGIAIFLVTRPPRLPE